MEEDDELGNLSHDRNTICRSSHRKESRLMPHAQIKSGEHSSAREENVLAAHKLDTNTKELQENRLKAIKLSNLEDCNATDNLKTVDNCSSQAPLKLIVIDKHEDSLPESVLRANFAEGSRRESHGSECEIRSLESEQIPSKIHEMSFFTPANQNITEDCTVQQSVTRNYPLSSECTFPSLTTNSDVETDEEFISCLSDLNNVHSRPSDGAVETEPTLASLSPVEEQTFGETLKHSLVVPIENPNPSTPQVSTESTYDFPLEEIISHPINEPNSGQCNYSIHDIQAETASTLTPSPIVPVSTQTAVGNTTLQESGCETEPSFEGLQFPQQLATIRPKSPLELVNTLMPRANATRNSNREPNSTRESRSPVDLMYCLDPKSAPNLESSIPQSSDELSSTLNQESPEHLNDFLSLQNSMTETQHSEPQTRNESPNISRKQNQADKCDSFRTHTPTELLNILSAQTPARLDNTLRPQLNIPRPHTPEDIHTSNSPVTPVEWCAMNSQSQVSPGSPLETVNTLKQSPKTDRSYHTRSQSAAEPISTLRPLIPQIVTNTLRPNHTETLNTGTPVDRACSPNLSISSQSPSEHSCSSRPQSPSSLNISIRSQSPVDVDNFLSLNTPIELSNSNFYEQSEEVNSLSLGQTHPQGSSNGAATEERLNNYVCTMELSSSPIIQNSETISPDQLHENANPELSVHAKQGNLAEVYIDERPHSSLETMPLRQMEEMIPQIPTDLRDPENNCTQQVSDELRVRSASELRSIDAGASVRTSDDQQPQRSTGNRPASASAHTGSTPSGEEMDWSWRLRRPSWLRASMRRVTHFQLSEPPPPLPPLATTDTVLDILESNRRPNSAPGGGASRSRRPDFPRRYSSYSASILNSSSVTNLTQAAEPVAVESPSSDDDEEEEEEEEEDISSSSEGTRSPGHQQQSPQQGADTDPEQLGSSSPLGEWPHSLSSMLASLGCTLGLFNISRFAIFSVHFGANFIVQFLLLSLLLGIPLFTLNTSLGQCLCAGVMDMWHISPIFQGVGIALLVAQALIGIYSIVGISWMFIYFRDSFITKQDRYRWAEPYQPYREDAGVNGTWRLEETVPDYLNGIVLQRHSLAGPDSSFGHLKFQVAFNLAVVWMIVFVSLSKGLKSYGKVVYVFSLFPVFGMLVLCTKLLGLTPMNSTHQLFPETVWGEFFLNTRCWVAAMTEVFFTWGLFGAAAMQIASHNRHKHLLSRDMSLVVVLTLAVLLLSAFLANTCVTLLKSHGFDYIPSSFEHMSTYGFLHRTSERLPPMHTSTPVRYMSHTTLIAGTRIVVTADQRHQSGYQVLRLATELVPSTFALLGADAVSPFWAVLFYFVLILFGIAQQLCIWHCVITGIMAINAATLKSWETTITFFCCAGGFILGLPMTTELGIFVVYFLDYSLGCAWWIMLLYFLEIIAVFVVRGRPYSGETVVATLFNRAGCLQTWAAPMLIFTWNVILPVTLIVTCIAVFKSGQFRDLYDWRAIGYEYWPSWTRELGCTLQIIPIAIVPLICVAQTFRYLSNGPRDILDRIQLLYRPTLTQQDLITSPPNSPTNSAASAPPATNTTLPTPAPEVSVATFEDPPPKYTPPPSYTTATGARIAKLLRQSFRRSVRRLTNALSDTSNSAQPPPPDYAAVLVEINRTLQDQELQEVTHDSDPTASQSSAATNRTTLSAADVANILRSSFRRNAQRNRDAERLVEGAAPIHLDRGNSPPATRAETESKVENSSVI